MRAADISNHVNLQQILSLRQEQVGTVGRLLDSSGSDVILGDTMGVRRREIASGEFFESLEYNDEADRLTDGQTDAQLPQLCWKIVYVSLPKI